VNLFSDILGGTLTTAAGGEIVVNGATLDGTSGHVVTNSGTFTVKTGWRWLRMVWSPTAPERFDECVPNFLLVP
jgi:hypothetical protein